MLRNVLLFLFLFYLLIHLGIRPSNTHLWEYEVMVIPTFEIFVKTLYSKPVQEIFLKINNNNRKKKKKKEK